MTGTKITFIRHGETEWNKAMIFQGHSDSPLTSTGIAQAESLSKQLRNDEYDVLITSDQERARHTGRIINKYLNLKSFEDSRLRERSFGIMEGIPQKEVIDNHPEVYKKYINRIPDFQIPNGESLVEFNKRVINSIEEISENYKGKNVLSVVHGGVLDCIIRKIFGMNLEEERCFLIYNTSVNTVLIENKKWYLIEWGNIIHLKNHSVLNENS